ncbi:hypothetical protein ACH5RR_005168 [Cinchona calisaya]|uniref:Protein BZR1 homolog n=1 Tax=Cinchona calisaya TaxID=153742 RepID=A0ABD3AKD9_9GENT
MAEDTNNFALRGCIKTSKGPWVVRRTTTRGGTITKYRYPSDRERLNNKQRERNRRAVAHNIFAGLRAHGNYHLRKNADSNDLLRALCEEAGWHVEEDGTIYRKTPQVAVPSLMNKNSSPAPRQFEGQGYCTCEDNIDSLFARDCGRRKMLALDIARGSDFDLTLSINTQSTLSL